MYTTVKIALLCIVLISGCSFNEERSIRRDMLDEAHIINTDSNPNGSSTSTVSFVLPDNPNLSDYLQYATSNSPALHSAYYRWMAAVERIPQMRALPDPKLSYSHYLREVETRVGPQKNRFLFMQMMPWPTKILSKTDIAVRKALMQKYLFDVEKLNLSYRAHKAYYEYYYLGRSISIVKDNIILLKNSEQIIQARYKTAITKNSTLIKLQVELAKQEERVKSLEALQSAMSSKLNSVIGRSAKDTLPFPSKISGEMPTLNKEELFLALQSDNPGLKAVRAKILATKSNKRLAKAQYLPDLELGASFIETERRTDMNPDDNGKDPVMLTLGISLPLWRQKYAAVVREAEANRLEAENELKDKGDKLSAQLDVLIYKYNDAKRRYVLFNKTLLPKAEQALESSRTAFSAGNVGFLDILDAERTLLELRLMAERAQVDQVILLSELEMLTGKQLSNTPSK